MKVKSKTIAILLIITSIILIFTINDNRYVPMPKILSVSPDNYTYGVNKDKKITVTGENFFQNIEVYINGFLINDFTSDDPNEVSFNLPEKYIEPGEVEIHVKNIHSGAFGGTNSNAAVLTVGVGKYKNMLEYLDKLKNEKYIAIIAVKDDASNNFNDLLQSKFEEIGLNGNIKGKFRYGYAAVIDSGNVVFEKLSDINHNTVVEKQMTIDGLDINIESSGGDSLDTAKIIIDGKDYSLNDRGLNIVLYDKSKGRVVDSVSFDTCLGLSFNRMKGLK